MRSDPDEEFEVEEVCGKKKMDGDLYYFVKWKGYPEASNTWEPEENIYAKDKIEDFEAKFRQLPKASEKRKRKPVKESQIDPDFDFDDIPIAPPPKARAKKTTTRSGRVSKKGPDPMEEGPKSTPRGRPKGKSPVSVKETPKEVAPVVLEDLNYDDFYEKLNVRVPPSTYDTSDFDRSHLFHIRMSNYLSWIILEHHIHHFEQINRDARTERQDKLFKRLQFYHMKQELVDLILAREVGVWEAILCMNAAQRRLEIEKMRRSLRDNESIPIPIDYNIMKFVAQIDKRRRKQFGFVDQPAAKGKKTRKSVSTPKPTPKKRKSPVKKKAPPKRKKKKTRN